MVSPSASKTIDAGVETAFTAERQAPVAAHKPVSEAVVIGLVGAWDALCVFSAGATSMLWLSVGADIDWHVSSLVLVLGTIVALNLMYFARAYRLETLRQVEAALGELLFGWILTIGALVAILHITQSSTGALTAWLLSWSIIALLLLIASRVGLHYLLARWSRAGRLSRRIAVIGTGPLGQRFLRRLGTQPDARLQVVGVYDDRRERRPS